jgi:acyl transferase domain-containing protein
MSLAEGVALVLLKKLSDAIRDDNKIYCVLRDVFSNHDGHPEDKLGYTVPSSSGQLCLLHEIYIRRNQIDLTKVYYIEGHGTGTQVGDPIEANTLGKFFQRTSADQPLLLGSVKSTIGESSQQRNND